MNVQKKGQQATRNEKKESIMSETKANVPNTTNDGVNRDAFVQAVIERLERYAAEAGLRLGSLCVEDISETGSFKPVEGAGSPLWKMLGSKELDLLVVVGSGNDDIRWDDGCMDMGSWRQIVLDESRVRSFVTCKCLDGFEYDNPDGLMVHPKSEGRSFWLIYCDGDHEGIMESYPLIGRIGPVEPIAAANPDLNVYLDVYRSPDPATPSGEHAADFLADLLWNQRTYEGITTRIDGTAFILHKGRKKFMGLDPHLLDWRTIQPYAVSDGEHARLAQLSGTARREETRLLLEKLGQGDSGKGA